MIRLIHDFIELVETRDPALFVRWYTKEIADAVVRGLYATPLADRLESEACYRIHIRRAQELKSEVYCVFHGGDINGCPEGSHNDQ